MLGIGLISQGQHGSCRLVKSHAVPEVQLSTIDNLTGCTILQGLAP